MAQQFDLDFDGGLTQRFPEFMDCVRDSVYGCGRQFKAIAADLDMSASDLSKRLSQSADVHFALTRLPELLASTGNLSPIYWLVEKYCDDAETRQRKALAEIPALIVKLQAIAKEAAK